MRKVHGVGASPFVRKVRVALEEKGLEYELIPVMPMGVSEEFRQISPLGKIPVLEEDGWTVPDSSIIIDYLERTDAAFLEEWADTALTGQGAGPVFFNRVVKPMLLNQEPDQAAIDQALGTDLPALQDYLEKRLADGRAFFVGGAFSIADIAIGSCYVNLGHAGVSPDAARWPKLAAWVEATHARPSFARLIAEEKAMFGQAA
jgi:glutathione S-transferase